MTRNAAATTDRHTNTTHHPGGVPRPDRTPRRTTGGLVAFAAMPAAVVAGAFAPFATAVVVAAVVAVAVTATTVDRPVRPATGTRDERGDAAAPTGGVPAD